MLLYNRAAGLVMDDRPADALEILDVMAERYPESSLILELRLEAHVTLGDADEAFALLRQGIALDPDNHRYWHNLFEIHLQRGEQAEALEALRGYHERWPCDMDERIRWANLTAKLVGRRAQLAILEQGLELCGPEPELQNDIAFVLATAADPGRPARRRCRGAGYARRRLRRGRPHGGGRGDGAPRPRRSPTRRVFRGRDGRSARAR
jgi:predicted Zn-dependent protease